MKIKNEQYRQFLDTGTINTLNIQDILQANTKNQTEKALLLTMYYTGARPSEILELKGKHITKQGRYTIIHMKGKKGGLPRKIHLKTNTHTNTIYQYAKSLHPEMTLFHKYKNTYLRTTKKGTRIETTSKLGYYFKKWFNGTITPYFLRHNRFSKLMEAGADYEQIRILKGSKTTNSVMPYIHLSTKKAKQTAKLID